MVITWRGVSGLQVMNNEAAVELRELLLTYYYKMKSPAFGCVINDLYNFFNNLRTKSPSIV